MGGQSDELVCYERNAEVSAYSINLKNGCQSRGISPLMKIFHFGKFNWLMHSCERMLKITKGVYMHSF